MKKGLSDLGLQFTLVSDGCLREERERGENEGPWPVALGLPTNPDAVLTDRRPMSRSCRRTGLRSSTAGRRCSWMSRSTGEVKSVDLRGRLTKERVMRPTVIHGLRIALCTVALAGVIVGHAQVAPTAPPVAAPTNPRSPAKPTPSEEVKWSAVATAQCRDGMLVHGKIDQHACAAHGGLRKLLRGRGQDLIR